MKTLPGRVREGLTKHHQIPIGVDRPRVPCCSNIVAGVDKAMGRKNGTNFDSEGNISSSSYEGKASSGWLEPAPPYATWYNHCSLRVRLHVYKVAPFQSVLFPFAHDGNSCLLDTLREETLVDSAVAGTALFPLPPWV